tara:strand:+ start:638 stop:814 length:177 start_codon:yes stop_codon:yes gene_type:complete
MQKHHYYIIDKEGFILHEMRSHLTLMSFDDYAKQYVSDLLPVIAKQYGIKKAFYEGEG